MKALEWTPIVFRAEVPVTMVETRANEGVARAETTQRAVGAPGELWGKRLAYCALLALAAIAVSA